MREADKFKYLDFNNTMRTNYKKNISTNVAPVNYVDHHIYKKGEGL